MNKTAQRQHAILQQLSADNVVSVEHLSTFFQVSEVTIRKDLTALEQNGQVLRQYGGARLVNTSTISPPEEVSNRKFQIGKLASTLVQNQSRIVIDSGSTTRAILPHLHDKQGLVIMTNSLSIANYITEQNLSIRLILTGGTWDASSASLQGKMAERMIQAYDFDLAFIGASGIEPAYGTTTFNELTQLSQSMANAAKQVVIMAESSKLNNKMPNHELPWSKISTFITDNQLTQGSKQTIQTQGVNLLCTQN